MKTENEAREGKMSEKECLTHFGSLYVLGKRMYEKQ
jgi:hypothetical protein